MMKIQRSLRIERGDCDFETRVWVGRHPEDPHGIKSRPIPPEPIERFR
jgi:hypothetical protein